MSHALTGLLHAAHMKAGWSIDLIMKLTSKTIRERQRGAGMTSKIEAFSAKFSFWAILILLKTFFDQSRLKYFFLLN